jgi:mono/diheme cytochrome c family protein
MPLRLEHARWLMSAFAGALGMFAAACTVTPLGATDTGVAAARAKSPPGADLFDRECASCHGRRGEGLTLAPAIMGSGALSKYSRDDTSSSSPAFATNATTQNDLTRVPGRSKRGTFVTAQDLYDYVSTRMPLPKSNAGTLKPEEYWAIVNYMLIANGTPVPADGVTDANAKSVTINH